MSLGLAHLVGSGVFGFCMSFRGAEQLFPCSALRPFSKVGNSELHSTRLDYYNFYGAHIRE